MATSRGNLEFIEEVLSYLRPEISPNHIRTLLNSKDMKGNTVLDMAIYNRQIQRVVAEPGGEHALARGPDEELTYVPENHHWNRRFHKAQVQKAADQSWQQADSSWGPSRSSWSWRESEGS